MAVGRGIGGILNERRLLVVMLQGDFPVTSPSTINTGSSMEAPVYYPMCCLRLSRGSSEIFPVEREVVQAITPVRIYN